ncbi:class I SAM-dependent methyltransferase [Enteractinococcus coprophilus]|uniref:Methyltransferase family protein n=1 Tax=Enteractinococcus coprophilus TaxID=1027633 RepID=A0A543AK34_9MICC|nr:class I SAM-dependent methyltransferase [Enteractinococcus coprophilus]TQL72942.1 methyltransferase family protein [Enteractinococcus coprophilus]
MLTRPTGAVVLNDDTRHRYRLAFDADSAELYHRMRPGYQAEILDFLTQTPAGFAVDLGAGTGLFATQLLNASWDVLAIDPAANMLQVLKNDHPQVTTVVSRVEDFDTAHYLGQAQLVVSAQAWHWVDTEIGCQKVTELLAPDGVFGVVHHQIDTTNDWVLRLCKIMHSGDVHAVDLPPKVTDAFQTPVGKWWHWKQHLTVEQVHELMMTRAFYLRTSDKQRQRMHNNLQWYLVEHLGYAPDATIDIPYVTAAWRIPPVRLGA